MIRAFSLVSTLVTLGQLHAQFDAFNWSALAQQGVRSVSVHCNSFAGDIQVRRDHMNSAGTLLFTTFFNSKGKVSATESFNIDREGNRVYNLYGDSLNRYERDGDGRLIRFNNTLFEYDAMGRLLRQVEYLKEQGKHPSIQTRRGYLNSHAYIDSVYAVDEPGLVLLRECWHVEVNTNGQPLTRVLTYHRVPPNSTRQITYEYSSCGLLLREKHADSKGVVQVEYLFEYTVSALPD